MPADFPLIDVNVSLGRWPTRRLPLDEPQKLATKLHSQGVVEAWVGSYDGLFHKDLAGVNDRLAELCNNGVARPEPGEGRGGLATVLRVVPFGEINPLLPNWEADLTRCAETHRMPGIRLHPNYHGYALDHPNFVRLLKVAAERKLIVALAPLMEDERMMHPLLRVPIVDPSPLPELVRGTPGLRLVLLNALAGALRNDQLYRILDAGQVYVEIAMLEGVGGIEILLKDVPLGRILFGSQAPSFYFESALLKLQESPLPATHVRAIAHENARRLLPT